MFIDNLLTNQPWFLMAVLSILIWLGLLIFVCIGKRGRGGLCALSLAPALIMLYGFYYEVVEYVQCFSAGGVISPPKIMLGVLQPGVIFGLAITTFLLIFTIISGLFCKRIQVTHRKE